jgi:hypothetical protein
VFMPPRFTFAIRSLHPNLFSSEITSVKYTVILHTRFSCAFLTAHEETSSRLNSGNDFYHSVQNLLSSRLLSTNVKIKLNQTKNLPVVLYGCGMWSLALREKHKLGCLRTKI